MITTSQLRAGLIGSVSLLGLVGAPLAAQSAPTPTTAIPTTASGGVEEILVTAQRTSQSMQDVPIAVSAFSAQALERQQINTSSDLMLTLPNVTFTQTNFGAPSFTIRGIGDLCVGITCDSATGKSVNELPLLGTRLFQTEFFDLERVEVLRGPQGTLYGRNATSGQVNFITAKPQLDGVHASGDAEYGNFKTYKLKGMINLPITDTLAVRLAGFYLNREGFTRNTFNNTQIDGRNLYSVRASVRWQPTDDTTIDLMAYRFGEKDNRSRIQKQLCDTDPLGILGCLPSQLTNGITNGNSTLGGILTSKQFFAFNGLGSVGNILALSDLNSPTHSNSGVISSPNLREVNTAFTPQDKENEQQYMARIKHDFGSITAQVSGMYQSNDTFSQLDYNMAASNPASSLKGLQGLQTLSQVLPFLKPVADLLIPNGPNGPYCSSLPDTTGGGIFGKVPQRVCAAVPLANDEISGRSNSITAEAIVSSQFDGPFNFLAGAIYINSKAKNVSYYVNAFQLDYASGVLGSLIAATATPTAPTGLPGLSALTPSNVGPSSSFLATPFFRSHADQFTLTSTGIFGETYYQVDEKLKVTVGVRYNNDKKFVKARATIFNCLNPIGIANANLSCATADYDPNTPGRQDFAEQSVKFGVFTGRAVVDYKISDENLIYASYSRGYKSGGINPPLSPGSTIPPSFSPEYVNAVEIGSKNTFLDGKMRANITAFYYQYKGLQLSSIQERTSVNQNINANIYGLEGEFLFQPLPAFTINMNASYLKTKVSDDQFLINPADPSGGRSDAVIIKDITNASNCAVTPNVPGNAAAANSYVAMINNQINLTKTTDLKAPVAFPTGRGLAAGVTGAYSVCSTLAASAAANNVSVAFNGVTQNARGNELPQAPNYKFSVGAQYVVELPEGLTITPRADFAYTGKSFGSIYNTNVNRVPSYYIVNAQIQINGVDNLWYGRAYVQNAFNNNAITGLYVSDQSSGLFSNIFTLEPRRYGASIGFRF